MLGKQEQEQSRGAHLTRRRTTLLLLLGLVCLLFLVVGFVTTLVCLKQDDSHRQAWRAAVESEMMERVSSAFRSAIISGYAASEALAGYVLSRVEVMPSINGTVEERLAGQEPVAERFPHVAAAMASIDTSLAVQTISPGGAILGVYPMDKGILHGDVFKSTSPAFRDAYRTREVQYVGPRTSLAASLIGVWTLMIVNPIYNARTKADYSDSNFWGFATVTLNISNVVEHSNLTTSMEAEDADFLLYYTDSAGFITGVYSSLNILGSQDDMKAFIDKGRYWRFLNRTQLYVSIQTRRKPDRLTATIITAIVAALVGGVLLLFVIAAAVLLCCTRAYDGRPHAPKAAPFALLIIGPTRGDRLWEAAPDVMPDVQRGTDAVLRSAMAIYHAYQIPATHPYTSSYVTRTVDAAVHMAMHVLEELQRRPVDGPLRAKLGERDGRLLLSCAIHWCTGDRDAAHVRPQGKAYVYEGTSVKEGTRLWLYAAPNTVTLSGDAAHPYAAAMRGVAVAPQRTVTLATRIDRPVELFTATDPASKLLAQAQSTAKGSESAADSTRELRELTNSSRTTSNLHEVPFASMTPAHRDNPLAQAGESDTPLLDLAQPSSLWQPLQPPAGRGAAATACSTPFSDATSSALLRPTIPPWLDNELREAFEQQAVALDVSYDAVQVLVFYFFVSLKLLFRPLAAPERANIFRRLVTVFGVPQQNILDHLAARCSIRYLQQHEEGQLLLRDRQQQIGRSHSSEDTTSDDRGEGDRLGKREL